MSFETLESLMIASPTSIFESPSKMLTPVDDADEESEGTNVSVQTTVEPPQLLPFDYELASLDDTERPKPILWLNTRKPQVYRVFSEDEEPVLRESDLRKTNPVESRFELRQCGEEKVVFFDVRHGIPVSEDRACVGDDRVRPDELLESLNKRYYGAGPVPPIDSNETPTTIIDALREEDTSCKPGKNCPYEMKPKNVSMNEFSDRELRVIRGIWKCIKFDLSNFGSLVTLNLFEIIGNLKQVNQKATPDALQQCKILLPHARLAMEGLNKAVEKFHEPWKGQDVIYEMGKAHDRLKIDFSQEQSELVVNAFLLTLAREVHPKLTLKEMSVMRRFLRTTMNLLVEGSRWNREPPDWLMFPVNSSSFN